MAKTTKVIAKKGDRARALDHGFYRGVRRREGSIFALKEGDKLGKWMHLIPAGEKLPEQPPAEVLDPPVALSELAKKTKSFLA
jgi:hypothetical protein